MRSRSACGSGRTEFTTHGPFFGRRSARIGAPLGGADREQRDILDRLRSIEHANWKEFEAACRAGNAFGKTSLRRSGGNIGEQSIRTCLLCEKLDGLLRSPQGDYEWAGSYERGFAAQLQFQCRLRATANIK